MQVDVPSASDELKEDKQQQQQQQSHQHRPPTPVYLSLPLESSPATIRPHSANATNIYSRFVPHEKLLNIMTIVSCHRIDVIACAMLASESAYRSSLPHEVGAGGEKRRPASAAGVTSGGAAEDRILTPQHLRAMFGDR